MATEGIPQTLTTMEACMELASGPEELPQPAPVRYLLVTSWKDEDTLNAWLESPEAARLSELGDVSSTTQVQVRHVPGERRHLTADGALRGWERPRRRDRMGSTAHPR
jgi:antibiotic biosynthesis monooxygenase (ABM) superfamily enzyme